MAEVAGAKLQMRKENADYYSAGSEPEVVEFGAIPYIVLEGSGEPGGDVFQRRINVLFSIAYSVKGEARKLGMDFSVPPLEALWWTQSGTFTEGMKPSEWFWKLMIRVPGFVTGNMFAEASRTVAESRDMMEAMDARLERIDEGRFVQMLHVGPYSTEEKTYGRIMEFIMAGNLVAGNTFHEIYLSDPSRTTEDRYRTIIRVPVG